jgi:hypothetical protein
LGSYLSDYFNIINKINQHYRTNKPVNNLDYLFNKAEFLSASCIETKQALYDIYSDIDNIDDDCIIEGMPRGRLVLHDNKVHFICKYNGVDNLICEISMPKSAVDLTFVDRHGKIQEEVTVVAFMQRANTLMNREDEYIKNREGYLHERCGKEYRIYGGAETNGTNETNETNEVQCICIH